MTEPQVNPYQKPMSEGRILPRRASSPFTAVAVGVLIDVSGTLVIAVALFFGYGFVLDLRGMGPNEREAAVKALGPFSLVGILGVVLGSLVSVVAGYSCARIAKRWEYRYTAILAAISLIFAVVTGVAGGYPLGWNVFLGLITVGAVFLGAHVGVQRNRRSEPYP